MSQDTWGASRRRTQRMLLLAGVLLFMVLPGLALAGSSPSPAHPAVAEPGVFAAAVRGVEIRDARACGSFREAGLRTAIRVKVTRGSVPCGRARQVMRSLFAHKRTRVFGWSCIGPQTGYGACRKAGNRIEAGF